MNFNIWLIKEAQKRIKFYSSLLGRSKEIDIQIKELIEILIDSIKKERS